MLDAETNCWLHYCHIIELLSLVILSITDCWLHVVSLLFSSVIPWAQDMYGLCRVKSEQVSIWKRKLAQSRSWHPFSCTVSYTTRFKSVKYSNPINTTAGKWWTLGAILWLVKPLELGNNLKVGELWNLLSGHDCIMSLLGCGHTLNCRRYFPEIKNSIGEIQLFGQSETFHNNC